MQSLVGYRIGVDNRGEYFSFDLCIMQLQPIDLAGKLATAARRGESLDYWAKRVAALGHDDAFEEKSGADRITFTWQANEREESIKDNPHNWYGVRISGWDHPSAFAAKLLTKLTKGRTRFDGSPADAIDILRPLTLVTRNSEADCYVPVRIMPPTWQLTYAVEPVDVKAGAA